MSVYDNVNLKELDGYAEQAGLGDKMPVDFLQFKKYLKKGDKILEIGCGTGRIGRQLLKDYKYIGIEQHKPYLDDFKNYLTKKKIKNIEDILIYSSFEDYRGSNFDVIIFSWSVIADFAKNKQFAVLKKAKGLLKHNGLILVDGPAKDSAYNVVKGHDLCLFYFDDWKDRLAKIFSSTKQVLYKTSTNRMRELIILKNE